MLSRFTSSSLRIRFQKASYSSAAPAQYAGGEFKPQSTTLENGIKVTSVSAGGPLASVSINIAGGSSQESVKTAGAFHFLKHLAYKSTSYQSSFRTTRLIEDTTTAFSVSNKREAISYNFTSFPASIEEALSVASTVLSPRLPHWEIEEARESVQVDMANLHAQRSFRMTEAVHDVAFRSVGLGRSLTAPEFNIHNISQAELRQVLDRFYVGNNMVISAVGVADHQTFVALVEKNFKFIPASAKTTVAPVDSAYYGGESRLQSGAFADVAVGLPFKGHSEFFVASVLKHVLGIARRDHIVYPGEGAAGLIAKSLPSDIERASCEVSSYAHHGLLIVKGFAGEEQKAETVASFIFGLLESVASSISAIDLSRAVALAKADVLALSGSRSAVLDSLIVAQRHVVPAVQKVSEADLQKFVKEILASKPSVVVFGDSTGLKPRY